MKKCNIRVVWWTLPFTTRLHVTQSWRRRYNLTMDLFEICDIAVGIFSLIALLFAFIILQLVNFTSLLFLYMIFVISRLVQLCLLLCHAVFQNVLNILFIVMLVISSYIVFEAAKEHFYWVHEIVNTIFVSFIQICF